MLAYLVLHLYSYPLCCYTTHSICCEETSIAFQRWEMKSMFVTKWILHLFWVLVCRTCHAVWVFAKDGQVTPPCGQTDELCCATPLTCTLLPLRPRRKTCRRFPKVMKNIVKYADLGRFLSRRRHSYNLKMVTRVITFVKPDDLVGPW